MGPGISSGSMTDVARANVARADVTSGPARHRSLPHSSATAGGSGRAGSGCPEPGISPGWKRRRAQRRARRARPRGAPLRAGHASVAPSRPPGPGNHRAGARCRLPFAVLYRARRPMSDPSALACVGPANSRRGAHGCSPAHPASNGVGGRHLAGRRPAPRPPEAGHITIRTTSSPGSTDETCGPGRRWRPGMRSRVRSDRSPMGTE